MRSINAGLLITALVLNLLAMRLGSLFLPDRMYFSFSSFLFDTRDLDKPLAIMFKMMVPFLLSFAVMMVILWAGRLQASVMGPGQWLQSLAAEQAVLTLGFAAFFAVLLMAWPYILLWDILIAPELSSQRVTFLVAYFAYFLATALFAVAGGNTAVAISAPKQGRAPLTLATLADSPLIRPLLDALGGTFSAGIATLVALQGS